MSNHIALTESGCEQFVTEAIGNALPHKCCQNYSSIPPGFSIVPVWTVCMITMFRLWAFAFLLITAFLIGCATSKGHWEKARTLDTINAYEQFLATQPKSDFENAAVRRLAELRFEQALVAGSIEAYEQFLSMPQPADLVTQAQTRIASLTKKTIVVSVVPVDSSTTAVHTRMLVGLVADLLAAEGLVVCRQEQCDSTYEVWIEAKLNDVSTIFMGGGERLTGFKLGFKSAVSITYSLRDPSGKLVLIDSDGIDYSKVGITCGPVPRDSRFFVRVSSFQTDWAITDKLREVLKKSLRNLLVPAVITHRRIVIF